MVTDNQSCLLRKIKFWWLGDIVNDSKPDEHSSIHDDDAADSNVEPHPEVDNFGGYESDGEDYYYYYCYYYTGSGFHHNFDYSQNYDWDEHGPEDGSSKSPET